MKNHYHVTLPTFLKKVSPEPNTGCWLWDGKYTADGYGRCHVSGLDNAHRVSYFLHNGDFDRSLHVLHKCDVRCCVNPDHLFLGTHLDNIADRNNKGRTNRPIGSKSHRSKIDELDVLGIRYQFARGMTMDLLSIKHQVSEFTIWDIVRRRTWNHI
jgi:hypothetical protein